jgi:energy-coupling factor transporter ATP-binding protein EcfA2
MTVAVGANNAGKSTLVEALRLVSLVVGRFKGLAYRRPPAWTELSGRIHGVTPSTKDIDLRGGSVFHRYGSPPAVITAVFLSSAEVDIYIGEDNAIFAVITDENGSNVSTKGQANQVYLPMVELLPQIGPLLQEEQVLNRDYVLRSIDSSLASRHFRNQLQVLRTEYYDDFQQRAESSWPGLRLESLDIYGEIPTQELSLLLRDGNFAAEVGWMGHGLQMWLQTMWFLARARDAETVILDEPDVYMHADLQRKLIRLLRGRHRQTIIATHSVEIMSEVSAEEILIVDKTRHKSSFAASLPSVQKVINRLGGVQNIHLARLWGSRKCLHVEGKDVTFLKYFQDKLFPTSDTSFLVLPRMSIGGWSEWNYAIGSTMSLKNAAGQDITSYCILDSDYHSVDEINERYEEAEARQVQLHIWRRKEIENYLLVPAAIQRIIACSTNLSRAAPSSEDVEKEMFQLAGQLHDEVFDAVAHEFQTRDRAGGTSKANRKARAVVDINWESLAARLQLVSGKTLLSSMSKWAQEQFSVSFGPSRVASEIRLNELDGEVSGVIRSIEYGRRFSSSLRDTT